jgi:ribosomal protein L7/L12
MLDAAPLICVALVVVLLAVGWVLGRRRRSEDSAASPIVAAEVERRLRELLVQRQKVQAVQLLRDHTGADLRDAKDAVDRMDVGQPLWLPGRESAASLDLPAADLDRVRALKRQGRQIEAIRAYREMTGLSVKEAKDAVDSL